tara:strand:+ start:988 stop:1950 length:963 start_codon:yes stop_codon:yes gene_type:complete
MRFQKLLGAFVIITALGILYDKYKDKYDPGEDNIQFNLVQKHLLNGEGSDKPVMWVHTEHNTNSRYWSSFYSRSNNKLNQPYINMCIETIVKWSGDSFNICLINDDSFHKLLPSWTINLDKLPEPLKSRTRQLGLFRLLHKYGGTIVPNSFLMMRDFLPYHKQYLGKKGCYVGEFVSRNNISEKKRLFPSHRLVGCDKGNKTIKDLCNYLEVSLSTDNSAAADFEGNLDRNLFKKVNSGVMSVIPGNLLGTKTKEGYVVLLDDLLKEGLIKFDSEMFGIYLPKDEMLKRRNYEWFVRSNKVQILSGNTILAKMFTLSYSN